ncbi:MAG TPA: hypothetical protein VGA00_13765 [Acidiferrobacterales bacterium]
MPEAATMVVVLNGESRVEYDRRKPLPGIQRRFLDKMDTDMNVGLTLNGEHIAEPDLTARAQFVALHLVRALKSDDDERIAALCAYLANRLPKLHQVAIQEHGDEVAIDLVFDRPYVQPAPVKFVKPPARGGH